MFDEVKRNYRVNFRIIKISTFFTMMHSTETPKMGNATLCWNIQLLSTYQNSPQTPEVTAKSYISLLSLTEIQEAYDDQYLLRLSSQVSISQNTSVVLYKINTSVYTSTINSEAGKKDPDKRKWLKNFSDS